jgi:hypothetical protein
MRRLRHLKPREIQGCAIALDAERGLFDAASGGSPSVPGGVVARWEDQSGNARHFTQWTALNRPIRQVAAHGGSGAVRFDGSDDALLQAYAPGSGLDVTTIFVAVRWLNTSQASYRTICSFGGGSAAGGSMLLMLSASQRVSTYGVSDLNSNYTPAGAAFAVSQFETTGPATVAWRVNRTDQGSVAGSPVGQNTGTHVGGAEAGQHVNMDLFTACLWLRNIGTFVSDRLTAAAQRRWRFA